jgi:RNA polymerase sigma factor (sigma-70 family)
VTESLAATHLTIETVWKIESARLIAGLTRLTGDVGDAEELAQDALVAALEQWPNDGVPPKPGAWLMATAKHRAIDRFRRGANLARKYAELGRAAQDGPNAALAELDAVLEPDVGDDLLRLMFIACHPVLSPEVRVALTLRLLGGLTTDEIARAYLVPEATVAQRIVRAKRTLREAQVSFELPDESALADRLSSVLEVIYLIFNEGYAATAGADLIRPRLCEEAMRLGRILERLAPAEPEATGLLALMELQASRMRARVGPGGEPILLLDQDRSRWDQLLLHRGLAALDRALASAGDAPGPYVLQAAIAGCHARARTADGTDWPRIARLYGVLAARVPSPVVELNRAVAVAMAEGPAAGLAIVDRLASEPALATYHLLPRARADLLSRLNRHAEAAAEFDRAASLTRNERERAVLAERAAHSRADGGRRPV